MNSESSDEQPETQPAEEYVAELVEDSRSADEGVDIGVIGFATPGVSYDPSILVPPKPKNEKPAPKHMEHLASKGGAVGAIVLGVLAFFGSFITSYAILNSFMGLALGLWGLKSNYRRTAFIGMALCLIAAFFCVVEISAWLQTIWPTVEAF
jgi:hypothetical protein